MRYPTLIILLFSISCFGQDSTQCKFIFPNEGKFEIRLDSSKIFRSHAFNVSSGEHYVEIWNGGMELIVDTIHPSGNEPQVYRYRTERNQDYLKYQKDLTNYRVKMFGYVALPFALSAGLSVGTFLVKRRADLQYEDVVDFHSLYDPSTNPEFLESFPTTYSNKVKKYESNRKLFYTSLSLSIVSVGFNAFTIWRFFSKYSKPKNTYYTSPFSEIDYSLNIQKNGAVAAVSIRI